MRLFGTLYALTKLRGILRLFAKENAVFRLVRELTGELPHDLEKKISQAVDDKTARVIKLIRTRQ